MSVQFEYAPEGKEFSPTYHGRNLKDRFRRDPKLKKRVPKHWLGQGFVEMIDSAEAIGDKN